MATWNPSNVILTLKGNEILSKVQAGIGSLKVSRIVSGAGFVSPSQLYKQTAVSNIKQVFSITEVNTDSNGSEIAITLDNKDLDEGYELYQIGVYVTHQDYQGEVLYTIAQCDVDSPDTIPSPSVTVAVFQYSLYLEHSNVSDVTINVNPDGYVTIDRIGAKNGVASLDSSGKVPVEQIPELGYDPSGSADEVRDDLNSHVSNYKNPHKVSAEQTGAIPSDQKGSNDGVAELDSFGHVPPEQMPGYSLYQGVQIMGKESVKGNVIIDSIHGNTVLSGVPSYNSPVELNSVEGPLCIHISGKNLVDFSRATKTGTASGVSYSISDDGALILSGVCDRPGSSAYIMPFGSGIAQAFYLPAGSYYLSGLNTDYSASKAVYLYLNCYNGAGEAIVEPKPTVYGPAGVGFTLPEGGAWVTVNAAVKDGTDVTGVTITPQIEAGSKATDFEPSYSATVDIPLLGTDGQELEPLRMAYGGNSSTKTAYYDRIVRRNGVWCIERSVAERALTDAVWVTGSSYAAPYFGGSGLKDGATSYLPFCTHFPPRAGAAAGQDTGVWVGNMLVVGNQALPNGASTTAEELKAFCTAQAEVGTPVTAVYALKTPIYEELHQDIQVLLNTLSVPGGVCSVWFEGDILPSGADIGLPRGDYPCSGVEGAYRWLAELSGSLPTPTQNDLYAWALSQQRGGVFATDGSTTTKNVPEAGNLTGILSVTEQGTDVSMIVFGPTGKIHTSTRIEGVWRGWTTLYSPLNKPTPADLGAAEASHNHSANQITSGVLPLARGGLGASTWSTALDNLHGMARQATYYNEASAVDIDAITDGLALVPTAASKGCPISGSFVFIMQMFYGTPDATRSRTQIAFPYAGGNGIAVRSYDSSKSVWSEWNLVYTANTPPPVMTGATSSKAGTAGLAPAPASGAQGKFLRGDGTWQYTPNTEYDDATTSKSGLMSASDKTKLNGIEDKANNYVHPSYTQRSSGIYKITVDSKGHVSAVEQANTGRAARFVIGTSTAGWTLDDCDYLCDGTSDDVEIKSAINALPSGGGEILLLDGTYNIGSKIAISKASVTLRGSGASTVLKRMFNELSSNGVVGCSASDCLISCIRIDGNKTAYTSRENRGLYASMSAKNITIEDVIVDSSFNGIALSGMDGCYVSRCTVRTTSSRGIYMSGVTNPTIDGCLVSGNGGDGIVSESCQNIHILNNNVLGIIDTGIKTDTGCTGGIIQGNTVDAPRDENSISIYGSSFIVMGNIAGTIYLSATSKDSIVQNNVVNSAVTERGTNNIVGNNVVVSTEVQA